MLAIRIKTILPKNIHPAQAAFINGRDIIVNIVLTNELLYGFNLSAANQKFCSKIDLTKAFDHVNK